MSNGLAVAAAMAMLEIDEIEPPNDLHSLLARRRSIRRLRSGPFGEATQERIHEAIRLAPTAYNAPSSHVVLVHEERDRFWDVVADAFRERLDGDRRDRYLARVEGFRGGVAVALIYEDV